MPFVDFADMPWQPELVAPRPVPSALREILFDHGSLTARLKQLHQNNFFVRVLQHHWSKPTKSEQSFLDSEDNRASIREVLLFGSGRPVVFARSVLPESSLSGENQELLKLGDKPLGEYIFNQSDLVRGPIEVAVIPARQFNSYLDVKYQHEPAWARRSLFHLNGKPISVCEVFLPEHKEGSVPLHDFLQVAD